MESDELVADGALVNVLLPDVLSQNAQIGKTAFDAKCSACHGISAAGQDGVHRLWSISSMSRHHGDNSFQRAAAVSVHAHHWPFKNMPAIEGITCGDVTMIIACIRELQRTNQIN